MKAPTISIQAGSKRIPGTGAQKLSSTLKRMSPFLLLVIFLVFWLLYTVVTNVRQITAKDIILVPFISANVLLVDFAVWNYFAGKKKGIIWMVESIGSAFILCWFF